MDIKLIVGAMTLEEKIGQKIMLDFRYWNQPGEKDHDMTEPNNDVQSLIVANNIGGIILFSNNLKTTAQIKTLTRWYASLETKQGARLLIGTDNEGGNVFRLPRGDFPSFPGNMALGAAVEGGASVDLAFKQGQRMAQDMLSLSINTNFAPVVDVNTNPYNPVINVRSFSDDVAMVTTLAEQMTAGMRSETLITTYKHFPGHGATSADSHDTLPSVNRTREEAFAIDIAPYQRAISEGVAPDLIMTAHIQYASLDNTLITDMTGKKILIPATMSREIQTNILRNILQFKGVTISDALSMGAITNYFTRESAIENVFKAGVDIALMPIGIYQETDSYLLPELIAYVANQVRSGVINEDDITASVERILQLKLTHSLLQAPEVMGDRGETADPSPDEDISDDSITLLQDARGALPISSPSKRFFIFTPWMEQGAGIAQALKDNGYGNVEYAKQGDISNSAIIEKMRTCDVFVIGTMSADFGASAYLDVRDMLFTIKNMGKTVVIVSMRSPYDIVYYVDYDIGIILTTYSYYGYENGAWRGPSMRSLAEILIGKRKPVGKLPVDTYRYYDTQTNSGRVADPYKRGFGLTR